MKLASLTLVVLLAAANRLAAQANEVFYSEGSTRLKGYLVVPKDRQAKKPGVVILHAWMGPTAHERKTADDLAALGYFALAADVFGENARPANRDEAAKLSGTYKADRKTYRARIQAAVEMLVKSGADPNRIAVMGYCFGGTGALEAARANLPVKGVISVHGGLDRDPKLDNGAIMPRVLVLHGGDDPVVSREEMDGFLKEMRDTKADWQLISYGDAVHGFTHADAGTDKSKGVAYNPKAARRSWEHLKVFLLELFGA